MVLKKLFVLDLLRLNKEYKNLFMTTMINKIERKYYEKTNVIFGKVLWTFKNNKCA